MTSPGALTCAVTLAGVLGGMALLTKYSSVVLFASMFLAALSRFPSAEVADQAEFLAADCLTQAGHTDEALTAWERFIADFPQSPFAPTAAFNTA